MYFAEIDEEIPKNCMYCRFSHFISATCDLDGRNIAMNELTVNSVRPDHCPLRELKWTPFREKTPDAPGRYWITAEYHDTEAGGTPGSRVILTDVWLGHEWLYESKIWDIIAWFPQTKRPTECYEGN